MCSLGSITDKRPESVLYHTPCHDSFEGLGPNLLGRFFQTVNNVPNCCSEAETLAISRPDIANAMRERKREAIENVKFDDTERIIASNCPSCLSGLGRNKDLNIIPKHMAVLLAESCGGKEWDKEFADLVSGAEKMTF